MALTSTGQDTSLAPPGALVGASAPVDSHERIPQVIRSAPSLRTVAPGMLALATAFAVYGRHLVGGGFTLDDWALASDHLRHPGVLNFTSHLLSGRDVLVSAGGRPIAALYFSLTYGLFGTHMKLHLAWALVLAAAMSTLVYAVLGRLRVARLHRTVIALLVLIFPAADTPKLWPSSAQSQLAISLYLGGLLLALRGLDDSRRVPAWLLHAAAVVLYVLSALLYEIAVPAIFLAFLVYRSHASWRSLRVRAAVDWVALIATVAYLRLEKLSLIPTSPRRTGGRTGPSANHVHEALVRLRDFQGEARQLFTSIGIQDGPTRLPLVAAVALILLAFAAWVRGRDPVLRYWLVAAAAGIAIVAVGYVSFLPGGNFYTPLRPGIGNRTNIGASIGYVLLFYALTMLAGRLVRLGVARSGGRGSAAVIAERGIVVAALVLLVAVWVQHVEQDQNAWNRAYRLDERALAVLQTDVASDTRDTTVFTFGFPGTTAPLVPSFFASWDLTGALRMLRNQSLSAVPVVKQDNRGTTPVSISCTADSVVPVGDLYPRARGVPYGRALFVSLSHATSRRIHDQRECLSFLSKQGAARAERRPRT